MTACYKRLITRGSLMEERECVVWVKKDNIAKIRVAENFSLNPHARFFHLGSPC